MVLYEPLYPFDLYMRVSTTIHFRLSFRSFGRFTLVGTHVINSIHKFLYRPVTKRDREAAAAAAAKKKALIRGRQYQSLYITRLCTKLTGYIFVYVRAHCILSNTIYTTYLMTGPYFSTN